MKPTQSWLKAFVWMFAAATAMFWLVLLGNGALVALIVLGGLLCPLNLLVVAKLFFDHQQKDSTYEHEARSKPDIDPDALH